jgi:flavodoxin
MGNIIYFFSGTGNSLFAAKVVAEHIGNTILINMKNNPKNVPTNEVKIVGFCFPIFVGSIPPHVRSFMENVTIYNDAYIFVIATYAGFSGDALFQAQNIFKQKNK